MSLFRKFVQIGRLVVVRNGCDAGKSGFIVEVLDQNRALVDGPEALTGLKRQVLNFKDVALADFVANIPRGIRHKPLVKAIQKQQTLESWKKSGWAKKLSVKKQKREMNDFDRFKGMVTKIERNGKIREKLKELSNK